MTDAELRHHVMDRVCQCHNDLLRLVKNNAQLREIVEALAEVEPMAFPNQNDDPFCVYCDWEEDHHPTCPYRMAREWVDDGT